MKSTKSSSLAEARLGKLYAGTDSPLIALQHRVTILECVVSRRIEQPGAEEIDDAVFALVDDIKMNVAAVMETVGKAIDDIESAERERVVAR